MSDGKTTSPNPEEQQHAQKTAKGQEAETPPEAQRGYGERMAGGFESGMAGISRAEGQVFGFVRDTATGLMTTTGTVAGEGIHLVRDVANETLHAVEDVGTTAVGTARGLLVGVAGGIRDVAGTLFGRRTGGGEEHRPPPSP